MSDHDDPSRPAAELLVPAVGAAIFASDEPVSALEIADAFGSEDVEPIEEAVRVLQEGLQQARTGLCIETVAGGYRLATRSDVGPWVRHFFRRRNRTRLSAAGLETLAIVAYRQPVTAPEILAIRGKDSSAALKTLVDKKLLRLLGRKNVVGNPLLYGTSKQFLVHFGLNSLNDLPAIEDFDEFVEALAADRPELFRDPSDVEGEEPGLETAAPEPRTPEGGTSASRALEQP